MESKVQGLSNEAIKAKLEGFGWKMHTQRVSDMFRNPFYCGLLAHSALEEELVEGIQEKAISKELFLQVNVILDKNKHGYALQPETEFIPLKRFLKCEAWGSYLRGYKAWKNQEYYYKCNTKGCSCNKRADGLHDTFKKKVDYFNVKADQDLREAIKLQMFATYNELNKGKEETCVTLRI